jgi:hypothetical protein
MYEIPSSYLHAIPLVPFVLTFMAPLGACGADRPTLVVAAADETSSVADDSTAVEHLDLAQPGPFDDQPRTWNECGDWEAPTTVIVDGATIHQLETRHECFNGECGSNRDYGLTHDLLVAVGAEIEILTDAKIDLLPTVRRLSENLSFETMKKSPTSKGSVGISLDRPGIYHVEVQGDVEFDDLTGLNRFRHYLWVQVVDASAPCLTSGATSTIVTGIVDSSGCPIDSAMLNIVSLHPDFHCSPWPATISLPSRPGERFLRRGFEDRTTEIIENPPADLATIDSFVAVGELFESASDPDGIYVQRNDGVTERWSTDESGMGCA